MDVEERIARLIDPEAWECADLARKWGLPVERCERYEQKSRAAARRVIDGLGLKPDHRVKFVGHDFTETAADRWVTPWVEKPITQLTPEEIEMVRAAIERLRRDDQEDA